jgi:type VI secretion system protein ImpH
MPDPKTPGFFNYYPDLKVEFILAELMKTSLDPDNTVIHALGIFKRRYSKDLVRGEIKEYRESKRQFLELSVHRNGLYDLLPNGLFHQPQNRKSNLNPAQAIEEHKYQKQVERESRLFFLPFEQELYRLSLFLEIEERKSIFTTQNVLNNQAFIDFWHIPDFFNEQQICNLLYILPLAASVVGDKLLTRLCFESILNDHVGIFESAPVRHEVTETGNSILNNVYLGADFVIENSFSEVAPCLEIHITPSRQEDLIQYLEGGVKMKMLEFLLGYFTPFENDVRIHLVSGEKFTLAEDPHHADRKSVV